MLKQQIILRQGERSKALENLTHLRGDAVVATQEINLMESCERDRKNGNSQTSTLGQFFGHFKDRTFLRPFLGCLCLRIFGLDWSGYFNLASRLAEIKEDSEVHFDDSDSAAAWFKVLRIIMTVLALFYISKIETKGNILLMCISVAMSLQECLARKLQK